LDCGRKAMWSGKLGKYVCLDLDCDWSSEVLPDYGVRDRG